MCVSMLILSVCVCVCVCVSVCVRVRPCAYACTRFHTGPAVLHPRDGPHHCEGVRDGLLPHAHRRAQPPGLRLPQKPLRRRRHQVSLIFHTLCKKLRRYLDGCIEGS